MKLFVLLLILAALLNAPLIAQASDAAGPSPKETVTSPEGCRIEKYTIPSPSMKRDIRVVVVLPPNYDADEAATYPVLYALHGLGAPYTVWSDMSYLRKSLKAKPMIIASFDGDHAGWYVDATVKPDSLFKTFFFDEFMPYVEGAYRANGVRGVTGFSMGGFGAMNYMVDRPELFASVSALSGAFGRILVDGDKPHASLLPLMGPYAENKNAYDKLPIVGRLTSLVEKDVKLPPLMLHCGTEDYLLENNRTFVQVLIAQNKGIREKLEPQVADITDKRRQRRKLGALVAKKQIDFTYVESPGAHNWSFWLGASTGVADFHYKHFAKAKPIALTAGKTAK